MSGWQLVPGEEVALRVGQEEHPQLITQYCISQIFVALFRFHECVSQPCLRNLPVLLEIVDVKL